VRPGRRAVWPKGCWQRELARAAVAVGADGLLVEVHPCPEKAFSDGAQSLTLEGFRTMMQDLKPYMQLWKESRSTARAAV